MQIDMRLRRPDGRVSQCSEEEEESFFVYARFRVSGLFSVSYDGLYKGETKAFTRGAPGQNTASSVFRYSRVAWKTSLTASCAPHFTYFRLQEVPAEVLQGHRNPKPSGLFGRFAWRLNRDPGRCSLCDSKVCCN